MSYRWGVNSQRVLIELDERLQRVLNEVIKHFDVSLICGHRGEQAQNALFAASRSKVQYPDSKHNSFPSLAVDLQPHPYPEKDEDLREELSLIAGFAMGVGHSLGVEIRWGGDWDRDGKTRDNEFDDLFHLEVAG